MELILSAIHRRRHGRFDGVMTTNTNTTTVPTLHRPDPAAVMRAIGKRSYCLLSTVSPAGRPHAAGVLYEAVGDRLYSSTIRTSRKARNVDANPHVGVVVPIRRVPVGGPPSAIQFQATATVLAVDSPEIQGLVADGSLRSVTGHGELDLPGGCFVRIDLPRRMHTYGLGMSLMSLIRHPLDAAGIVELD